jgi:hypothetical protein
VLPPRWWAAQARYSLAFVLKNRLRDRADAIDFADEWRFERYLQQIEDESGVDIRVLLVPEVSGESLQMFSVREARAAGIGQGLDRRDCSSCTTPEAIGPGSRWVLSSRASSPTRSRDI